LIYGLSQPSGSLFSFAIVGMPVNRANIKQGLPLDATALDGYTGYAG
jgi:hypothetical protein